ncbi:MAG TPA: CDP-alcohol phosphatidyltransferase family protein [Terriglobales bacterium]|nr:MAG: CDP-alcohol phosphatidyltransferase [Acidobacteriota bacterium]HTC79504.1 CDP-alcohol phosphatidyltransferase family protein [Terriglobales bacterium]
MIRQLRSAPNQLTLLRLIFIPFVVISVVEDRYGWALALFVLAGLSDALDGLLARVLKQKTALGQYLDPIADKLLLSTLFLVLAFEHRIPWYVTVLVFSRDLGILIVSALLYATNTLRDLRPSVWGKANTIVQVGTILVVLMAAVWPQTWLETARVAGLRLTFALTLFSWIHYTVTVGQKLRAAQPRVS